MNKRIPLSAASIVPLLAGSCVGDPAVSVPENARGNRVQHVLLALEVEGVPCVRAALEPGDHPVGGSEHVHDFPFSLVAPLQA